MFYQPGERGSRIALCKPEEMVGGGSLMGVREEVLRQVPGAGAAPFTDRYQQAKWVFDFRYPLADFLGVLYDAAAVVAPTLELGMDPIEFLGHALSNTFARSHAGKMAVAMVKDKNPIDLLAIAQRVYNSRLPYGQRTFTRHSATSATLQVRGDPLPPGYYLGTLANTFSLNGYAPAIQARPLSLSECDYTVEWDGKPPAPAPGT